MLAATLLVLNFSAELFDLLRRFQSEAHAPEEVSRCVAEARHRIRPDLDEGILPEIANLLLELAPIANSNTLQ